MSKALRATLGTALALFAVGCAPSTGFIAQGHVTVTLQETSGTPSTTGFNFPPSTRIDPALPSGRSDGFIGTCSVGPNGRSVVLQRVGGDRMGLESATFTLPDWAQDTCASCNRGSASFVVGGASFTGSQTAGASSPCQFTTSRTGSFDMRLQVQCRGVQSGTRTADLDVDLNLDLCNGPMTRN